MKPEGGRTYTAVVVSSATQIRALDGAVRRLMPDRDTTLDPRFFLASMSEEWTPRVVVVSRGDDIVGVVYAKERRIGGVSTGIVFGDGRLGSMVVAGPVERQEIFTYAMQSLSTRTGVRAVRLLIPPDGVEARAIARVQSSLPVDLAYSSVSPARTHDRLALPEDFEAFLRLLGGNTRRNFLKYTRKFKAARHTYIDDLSTRDLVCAVTALRTKCRFLSGTGEIKRAVNTVLAVDRPWIVGLKHFNGDWLSIAAGWCSGDRAVMFLQLNNDREHAGASLSVVLRAHLIESLIRRGIQEMVFWSGSAPPLSRYASAMPAVAVHLDPRTFGWRLFRFMIGKAAPWLPRRMAENTRWIVVPKQSLQSLASSGQMN
jgi:hypothetical protein